MFGINDYGRALRDSVRLDAYAKALGRVVVSGSVVLNVDAGLGAASLIACHLGAQPSYAVDRSSLIQTLADIARDNGFRERLVVLQQHPRKVALPELADVIVSDVPGPLRIFGEHLSNLIDARDRFLKPGGRMIPESDTLWVAAVSSHRASDERRIWETEPFGLTLRSGLRICDNTWHRARVRPDELLSHPAQWARIDYPGLRDPRLQGSVTLTIGRRGAVHGLVLWADTSLAGDIGYTNAPGAREGDYSQMLLPWPETVPCEPGDRVDVEIRADPIGSDYVWTWRGRLRRGNLEIGQFRQSTFASVPLSPAALRRRSGRFVPALSVEGELVVAVLESMRAGQSIRSLAEGIFGARPGRFKSLDDAHAFVADLAERYSS